MLTSLKIPLVQSALLAGVWLISATPAFAANFCDSNSDRANYRLETVASFVRANASGGRAPEKYVSVWAPGFSEGDFRLLGKIFDADRNTQIAELYSSEIRKTVPGKIGYQIATRFLIMDANGTVLLALNRHDDGERVFVDPSGEEVGGIHLDPNAKNGKNLILHVDSMSYTIDYSTIRGNFYFFLKGFKYQARIALKAAGERAYDIGLTITPERRQRLQLTSAQIRSDKLGLSPCVQILTTAMVGKLVQLPN